MPQFVMVIAAVKGILSLGSTAVSRVALVLAGLALAASTGAEPEVLVHEWGTFTCLQDEQGRAIGGINSDDEPVPAFVHDLFPGLIFAGSGKGVSKCHPQVTMRLETPVVYFHYPKCNSNPIVADVEVSFQGGWLTQFYPKAEPRPVPAADLNVDSLGGATIGGLRWTQLRICVDETGPQTSDPVWLAPRAVSAESVRTPDGESERFLFYRGVGHIDSPLFVRRDDDDDLTLVLRMQRPQGRLESVPPQAWYAKVRPDGLMAYKSLGPLSFAAEEGSPLIRFAAAFAEAEFSESNRSRLKGELRQAIMSEGLFGDEADALLNTWERSYFQSPGARVFFTVPRWWTDQVLPISISVPHRLERVMIGRIELLTPQRRAAARDILRRRDQTAAPHDPASLAELGRFADAILRHEGGRHEQQ